MTKIILKLHQLFALPTIDQDSPSLIQRMLLRYTKEGRGERERTLSYEISVRDVPIAGKDREQVVPPFVRHILHRRRHWLKTSESACLLRCTLFAPPSTGSFLDGELTRGA